MAMPRLTDPYQTLGVARGATDAQIKAAHRRLAKRFHPDADAGDTLRFLHVQEAYKLLSDPLRRRDWDAHHAPGPVRANTPRPRPADAPTGTRKGASTSSGKKPRQAQPRGAEPRDRAWTTAGEVPDFGVYDRSSGAAWSMAARAYFRRGDQDLPRRGSFRHAGQVPLTAARARAAADDEVTGSTRPAAGVRRDSGMVGGARRRSASPTRAKPRRGLLAGLLARLRYGR